MSNTGQAGTSTTNLAWLKTHYFKFEKSGKANPTCGENGIEQVLVDYAYQIQCHVTNTPPENFQVIERPVC